VFVVCLVSLIAWVILIDLGIDHLAVGLLWRQASLPPENHVVIAVDY
jgi:hypothetical protein